MSQLKVNGIRHTSASSDAITLASDGTATAKITNRSSNIIVNGACNVAQRGTSSTSSGYYTVDRMNWGLSGHSVTVTQSQHALTDSDTGPWEKGFRNSAHIALSGAGTMAANTTMSCFYKIEAQDIANSGWDYTSASSYITISFWFKVSTAQTFYLLLFTSDGTAKSIVKAFTPGNTNWNKFTFKIPGASGVQFDNNADAGLNIGIVVTYGTDKTGSGNNLDSWGNYDSSERVPDMASTWLVAGASTYEFTGLQLEVGDVATEFEHRSYGDELARCHRYFYMMSNGSESASGSGGSGLCPIMSGGWFNSSAFTGVVQFPTRMRTAPSIYKVQGTDYFSVLSNNAIDTNDAVSINRVSTTNASLWLEGNASGTQGHGGYARTHSSSARIGFNAEL